MLKRLIRPIWRPIRRTCWPITAVFRGVVLPPWELSIRQGHARSALLRASVDRHGQPLPWYSYPLIDALAPTSFADRDVLEWGGGNSTFWWAERARSVTVLEPDRKWADVLRHAGRRNVRVISHAPGAAESAPLPDAPQQYDVLVVDGDWQDRCASAARSVYLMKIRGAIIVDDTEGRWRPDVVRRILALLRGAGFSRVDFFGFAPIIGVVKCTSVFFKGECFVFDREGDPTIHTLGRRV